VSLVRAARLSSAAAFVNAVLRRATREPEYDPAAEVSDPIEKIAVRTSHPAWLIERWSKWMRLDQVESFAHANNLVPPTAFRVVAKRGNQSEILSKLSAAGAALESSHVVDGGWRVSGATSLLRELSAAGEIYLQDEASQLVAQLLDAKPGERVLDLCAAPGGKTTMIADRTGDRAIVVAADRSAARMETVAATKKLHQLEGVKPVILDAAEQLPFRRETFDRVLIDAPCSGTGTLRRNPEIRWRLTPADIPVLAEQQQRILRNAIEMVKPGGRFVYSTCSVESEENEEVIEQVMTNDRRFQPLSALRTWPQTQGCDGFFMAVFERT
jgi:16S rRNA (cytosine967-C5)-methyltransferase